MTLLCKDTGRRGHNQMFDERCIETVYDVDEKTSTRRRSRIPSVVVEKNTTRRREDGDVVVEKI